MTLCHDERRTTRHRLIREIMQRRRAQQDQEERAYSDVMKSAIYRWHTDGDRKRYINSLTAHQRQALERIRFCIIAIGQLLARTQSEVHLRVKDLHAYFPAFAEAMGWKGALYRQRPKDGFCRGVLASFPTLYGDNWVIGPSKEYTELPPEKRKRVHTRKARAAAVSFCNSWLPIRDWSKVALK